MHLIASGACKALIMYIQEAKKAASAKTVAKSREREMENRENSMMILSSLDSPSHRSLYKGDSYSATSSPLVFSCATSSSSAYPASSSSPSPSTSFYRPSPDLLGQGLCMSFKLLPSICNNYLCRTNTIYSTIISS